MLKNIKNLEGVTVLSRSEQKSVNGGGYPTGATCTGNIITYNGGVVAQECNLYTQRTFLGMNWGAPVSNGTGPCPSNMICNGTQTNNFDNLGNQYPAYLAP